MSHARKVLVIDDERVVCNSCGKALEQEGYAVSLSTDGREGIEKVSRQDFDAVIVDLKMPGVGGMDVLRNIKQKVPATRVIIMTGYSSVATEAEARQLGAAGYLPKPFTPRELTDTVGRLFEAERTPSESTSQQSPLAQKALFTPEPEAVPEGALAEARILLANSNSEEMTFLRESLSNEPWQLKTVARRQDVIEMVRAGQADVLITGVDVLGMKVYDLIPDVKKLGGNIPIIVASGDPSLELARRVRELGIFFYLMEPFDQEEVRAVVRDAVKKAVVLQRRIAPPPATSTLVRCVRTITRHGNKVGLIITGEWVDENSSLYREIIAELKRRFMPMHTALARGAISARELPRYLEQDDKVILVAAVDTNAGSGATSSYSAEEFERLATEEQQSKLKELAYPEVLHWLNAQGISPELRIVFLCGDYVTTKGTTDAVKTIMNEVLT